VILISLLIAFAIIVTCLLIYDYFNSKVLKKKFKQISALAQSEINRLRDTEKHLKDEIAELQNKLHYSLEDPITQLPTRELFQNRLNIAIKEGERYQLTLGMLCVELHQFNLVNEAFGVETGNILLREVSKRLQNSIRQIDSIAHFASGRFGILLSKLNKPETAAIVAQRLLNEFNQPFLFQEYELFLHSCIGIAIYPLDAQEPMNLLQDAEHALDAAKRKGNNTYQFYQKDMQMKSQRKLRLYNSLNRETVLQECLLYYQPIVNTQSNKIAYIEVMLNFHHAELGMINSNEFFAAAENQGKLNIISEWLIEKVCKEFIVWDKQGIAPELIAVSLPITQLKNHHFIYDLSQRLQKIEFNTKNLLLQFKGDFSKLSVDIFKKTFNMLDFLKIKIAIDNIGTAILPLEFLQFNMHYLKIDPLLVGSIITQEKSKELIKSIVMMGKNLGLNVIAKGVDTPVQKNELMGLNCFLMQGQLFYPPLEEKEMMEKLRGRFIQA
jgi:diguanylate cyclase (GGDEF)-like protein